MLGWLKRRSAAAWIISDTRRTLDDVKSLPEAVQRKIAAGVCQEIVQSLREIERTPGPSSPERDAVIRSQLSRATAARHHALGLGASNGADPDWAAAAIIESWLLANSGTFGAKAFGVINGSVMAWVGSVLSRSELGEIGIR